jgi:hypothetical protein
MDGGHFIRTARAVIFAVLAVALSAGGHLALSGHALPVGSLACAGAAVLGLALLLTAGERSFPQIAGLLIPLQLALNAVFNLGQQTCAPGVVPSGSAGSFPGLLVCGGGSVRPDLLGLPSVRRDALVSLADGQILLLLALHILIALVAAVWLRQGEAAMFRLLRAVGVLLRPVLTRLLTWLTASPPVGPEPARQSPPLRRPGLGHQDVLLRTAPRRGPPALAPAC